MGVTAAQAIAGARPGSGLSVVPFDGDPVVWDEFIARADRGTFCHLAGWREIMEDILGHETRYRVAVDATGRWQGVLPIVRVRSRIFGHFLVSLPFLNYGGAVGTPPACARLADDALAEARRTGVDLLELRTRQPPPAGLEPSHRKITVLLDLPPTSDSLWRHTLRSKLRSQIRRPQKEGMETRFGHDQVGPFYGVFSRNMRDLGTPVLPRRIFDAIARVFTDQVTFGVVYWRGDPVAAGCGFAWGDEFEMTWASSLREHNTHAPNMLLYWSFMERAVEHGLRVFNFGRCTPGGGTHRFKRQWGGRDVPLPWAQWSPRAVGATPAAERPLYRCAAAAWRRLPLGIANRAGPPLARRIP